MKKTQKTLIKALTLLFIFLLFTFEASLGMSLFQNDFEKRWQDLSHDVRRLNEYTSTHPIELRKNKVGDKDLTGAIFVGATFTDVEWEGTILENAKFTKTVFKNCKFFGSLHWNGMFTDVLFENCTFQSAEFGGSTMVNVRFKNCKITDSRLKELQGNELLIEDSVLEERTSLAWSSIPMTFRRCTLDGVGLSGMKIPNKMIIEDSLLDEVDFGRGNFSDIILRRVKQSGGGVKFNNLTAKSISFEDVDMTKGTAIGRSNVGAVRISGGRFGTAFDGSTVGRIIARDAELSYMSFSEATLPYVEIAKCSLYDTGMWDGHIKEFLVTNSQFNIIVGENFKADTVVWDNVTLDGKIDLTNAQVKDFSPTRITRGPNLQLITTGSNMRFN